MHSPFESSESSYAQHIWSRPSILDSCYAQHCVGIWSFYKFIITLAWLERLSTLFLCLGGGLRLPPGPKTGQSQSACRS